MKLAAKQVELAACPYVTEASKTQLSESAAPPIRLINLKAAGGEVKVGNEVVMFRHEKTFYNKPGLFLRVRDDDPDLQRQSDCRPGFQSCLCGYGFDPGWLCGAGHWRWGKICRCDQSCPRGQQATVDLDLAGRGRSRRRIAGLKWRDRAVTWGKCLRIGKAWQPWRRVILLR